MKRVFVVQHVHVFGDGEEDVKMIGVYTSKESALRAVERLGTQPGFRDFPDVVDLDRGDGSGFHVDEYELDQDHWSDGYVTV